MTCPHLEKTIQQILSWCTDEHQHNCTVYRAHAPFYLSAYKRLQNMKPSQFDQLVRHLESSLIEGADQKLNRIIAKKIGVISHEDRAVLAGIIIEEYPRSLPAKLLTYLESLLAAPARPDDLFARNILCGICIGWQLKKIR